MNVKGKDHHQETSFWGDIALSPLEELPLAASLIRTERGMYGEEAKERSPLISLFPLDFFQTVAFVKRMEVRCKVEGEVGVEAVKIERDLLSVGSENEGEEVGLW